MFRTDAEPVRTSLSRPRGTLGTAIDQCTKFGVAAAFLVTALSFFGAQWWFLELFTHFRLQLAGGSILLLAAAMAGRHHVLTVLAGVTAAANFALLLPYVSPQTPTAQAAPNAVRILMANVGRHNDDYEAIRNLVESQRPDVVGLLEADRGWEGALSDLSVRFPYSVLRPEPGAYGIVLYSRLPMRELAGSPHRRDDVQMAVSVELDLPDVRATMVLAHLMAPLGPSRARLRKDQIADLAGMLAADSSAARILVGDLNITPWSPEYGLLERQAGLANARLGRGYLGTWPTRPALLRIPIDHCLVSGEVEVTDLRVGPDVGSDHLPLIVDLVASGPSHSGE